MKTLVLTLLGSFFRLVGQKVRAEIEKAKRAKRGKAIKGLEEKLKKQEAVLEKCKARQVARAKAEFARAEKSKRVIRETKAMLEAKRVEVEAAETIYPIESTEDADEVVSDVGDDEADGNG